MQHQRYCGPTDDGYNEASCSAEYNLLCGLAQCSPKEVSADEHEERHVEAVYSLEEGVAEKCGALHIFCSRAILNTMTHHDHKYCKGLGGVEV